jgi:thiamine kinase-like enzyme
MALYQSLLDKKSDKLLFDKALALHNRINADGVEKVFSHNDLHSSNLLWNQKYYFLDWEYSGLNHPCFDIASLVKNLELSQSQISELSNGYKGSNEFFHRSKLDEWIEFIDYLNKIWDISVQKIVENLELNKYL